MKFDYIFVSTSVWSSDLTFAARAHAHKVSVMPREKDPYTVEDRQLEIIDYLRRHGHTDVAALWRVWGDTMLQHVALEGLQDLGVVKFVHYQHNGMMEVVLLRKPSVTQE